MIPKELFQDLRQRNLSRRKHSVSLLDSIDSLYVEHPIFQKALEEVEAALGLHGLASVLPNLQISGVSGVGKTTLVEKIMARYRPTINGRCFELADSGEARCDEVPLLKVDMPVKPSVETLARAVLKAYGDPKHGSGDMRSVQERVEIFTYAMNTKAVLIDEAQRAVDRRGVIVKAEIAFWLQEFYENNYVSLIVVGLGRTNYLFEQDTQVERRWDAEIRMNPYSWGRAKEDTASRLQFIALLTAFQSNFPLDWPEELSLEDDNNCMRFFYASRGVIGLMKKLFNSLLRLVMHLGLTSVTLDDFRAAFDRAFRKGMSPASLQNPFSPGWEPCLPPDLSDDTKLIVPQRKFRSTAREKKAAVTHALTVTR